MDRTGTPDTGLRAVRAAVFTALCLALSSGAHVLLTAEPLPYAPLLLVGAAVFAIAFALAGRERGYWSIAGLLVPLELAADTVFTTGQHTCYGQAGGPVAGPLRALGLDLLCAGGDFGTPLARMAAPGSSPLPVAAHPAAPWLLLAAHVAVGLAAAAWLRRGDAALARLLRAAAVAVFRPLLLAATVLSAPHASSGRGFRPASGPTVPRALPLLVHSVVRRGPPCPVAVAA
ncbi:hypothetical protein F0L17_05655 [Streptomyces sp. TRM43335]|uniref:Integral membrane protein n=1 Tax=Streptomyces taklimakanensis TaxID=2569853 RepID=A0A6G2B8M2_9ACTN|nr:hypothetical protein [Streptomyces taklimakanensis]MTE18625.1 hypothetical protein [Streptomyces taklimakanensis]